MESGEGMGTGGGGGGGSDYYGNNDAPAVQGVLLRHSIALREINLQAHLLLILFQTISK